MVTRHWYQRLLPKHCSDLTLGDYLTYLGGWIPGVRTPTLEETWRGRLDGRTLIGTPTGRHALWGFLETADLQPGDEVLVGAYNFYVIVRLVIQKSLVPVFVDIDPETLGIDPADLERKITPRSRMVLVTHMFGNPSDMTRIAAICERHELQLFEDCAHAVGSTCDGKQVGAFGDGALFSFGVYKIVNTFGGGMLALRDPARAARLTKLNESAGPLQAIADNLIRVEMSWLMQPRPNTMFLQPLMKVVERRAPGIYHLVYPSGNNEAYRFTPGGRAPYQKWMTRLMARELARIEPHIARRRAIVERVQQGLAGVPGVRVLRHDKHGRSNCSYFGIWVPDPEGFARELESAGILANPHEYYDCSALAQFSEYARECPNARGAAAHVLRLPSFASMRDQEIERMIEVIRECAAKHVVPITRPAAGAVPATV
jgi:dTDP-4-amino-4,6-dideoxygalactose transaminase